MNIPTEYEHPIDTNRVNTDKECPTVHCIETNCTGFEVGPSYKDQCQAYTTSLNESSIPAENSPNGTERCSNSSNSSRSVGDTTYIPIVCGVLLHDNHDINELHEQQQMHNAILPTRVLLSMHSENEDNTMSISPEQAPIPTTIDIKRGNIKETPTTLTNAEKRYWVKVVLLAIVVNTILVMIAVMGGICGISGCHFSKRTIALENTEHPNITDVPTPSPSRRRISSDTPSVIAIASPTFYDEGYTTIAPSMTVKGGESITQPSDFPTFSSRERTMSPTTNDVISTDNDGVNMIVVIPVAIFIDAILIISYLFYHYRRRNRVSCTHNK